ncbi:MAG TPA: hypothetical protein VFD70_19335 [Anaerolineae bacterium]|nr:hypothetical protein [Anaerolineae bacterium]
MNKGFTEKEAKQLIGQSFQTHAPFVGVPMRAHGRVVEAIDVEDHWNVMIEWSLPGRPFKEWYNKHDLQTYMRPFEPPPDESEPKK